MKKLFKLFSAILVIGLFAFFALGSGDDTATVTSGESTSAETTTSAAPITINPSEVLTTSTLKITYSECSVYTDYNEYLKPKDGCVVIKLSFNVENISSSDQFVSTYDFHGYADNTAVDEYLYADDSLSATISAGRSTSGSVYYQVPKDAQSVEVEYETNYWSGKKAIFTVPQGWN